MRREWGIGAYGKSCARGTRPLSDEAGRRHAQIMVGVNPEQIKAQALQRLRVAAGRSDIEFQVIVTSRPVPSKALLIALLLAAVAIAWLVPAALGIDMTLGLTGRRLRHLPQAMLATLLVVPFIATRNYSLGFCADGSVVVARNGFASGIEVVQTLTRPEIVLEQDAPPWRPPRIGVGEWVWQVNFNDSFDRVSAWQAPAYRPV